MRPVSIITEERNTKINKAVSREEQPPLLSEQSFT